MDVFTGRKTEALVSHHLLISRLEVKWEHKQLIIISDDFFCSLIGDDYAAQNNVQVPNQVLGSAIRNFWAEGERNVMVMTARVMGINGVVSAWEVIEMKLLGLREAGMLNFENLQTDATIDIPYPMGENGEEIGRRGRAAVMEIHIPMWDTPPSILKATIQEISIGKKVRETSSFEDESS